MDDQNFTEWLRNEFLIIPIKKDGNCLYSAIALMVKNDTNLQSTVRFEVKRHIVNNMDCYADFLDSTCEDVFSTVRNITKEGEWGTQISIAAASDLYERNIIIVQPDHTRICHPYDTHYGTTIYLSYHNGNHYNLLIESPNDDSVEISTDDLFIQDLYHKGYHMEPMKNDGDSLYNALSTALYGRTDYRLNLKSSVKAYILQHFDRFENFYNKNISQCINHKNEQQLLKESVLATIEAPTMNDEPGNEAAIVAASQVFRRSIVVERPKLEPVFCSTEVDSENASIFLSCHDGNHFNLLHKINKHTNINNNDLRPTKDNNNYEPLRPTGIKENGKINVRLKSNSGFTKQPLSKTEKAKLNAQLQRAISFKKESTVDVVVLVYGAKLKQDKLSEALKIAKLDHVKVLIDLNSKVLHKFRTDYDLRKTYTIYSAKIHWPLKKYEQAKWVARLLTSLILCTLNNYKWNRVKLIALFRHTGSSVPIKLMKYAWVSFRDELKEDMEDIIFNPNILLCDGCSSDCNFNKMPCHFDPTKFQKLNFQPPLTKGILTQLDFFNGTGNRVKNDVITELIRLRDSCASDKLSQFYNFMDALQNKQEVFNTYMILLLNGPQISNYKKNDDVTYYQMVQDDRLTKSMFVAYSKDKDFDGVMNEFPPQKKASVTDTTRVYLLRHGTFKNMEDAKKDKTMVINILSRRLRIDQKKGNKGMYKYEIINSRLATGKLLDIPGEEYDHVESFCNSGIPIFNVDPTDHRSFQLGTFTGNYRKIKRWFRYDKISFN